MKVGILCSYEEGSIGGQTSKTLELIEGTKKKYHDINIVNQKKVEGNYITLLLEIINLFKNSNKVIIILASPGYFKILPILLLLNDLFHRDLYEIVIGGIRHKYIEKKTMRIFMEKKIRKIYVESNLMVRAYFKLGLKNVEYLPNFKKINPITEEELVAIFNDCERMQLCTFSRIDPYKGIDTAIEIVKNVKEIKPDSDITLDIFGPVDQDYKDEFEKLIQNQPDYICYKGAIYGEEIIDTLKKYKCLLFPTKWTTEGFPGSFIDAMAAGLAVLATDRENFRDIIINGENGFLIKEGDKKRYSQIILGWIENKEKLLLLKKNSLCKTEEYRSEFVLCKIWRELEREMK